MSDCCGGDARGAWIRGIAEKAACTAEPPGELREALRGWFHANVCAHINDEDESWGGETCDDYAGALLAGPLADLLAEGLR